MSGFDSGDGIVSREKMYEAKDDGKRLLAESRERKLYIYEITIPDRNREYVAVPRRDEGRIEAMFPASFRKASVVTK